jgi:hypothetical protein
MSTLHPDTDDDDQHRIRMNVWVMLFAFVAVGLLYLVVERIKDRVPPQDCHMAGFSHCQGNGPLITAPHRRDRLE